MKNKNKDLHNNTDTLTYKLPLWKNKTLKEWKTKSGYTIIKVLSGRSNVFLVHAENKTIMIDTSPGRLWKKLSKRIKRSNIHHIDILVLTHAHYDHAANANRLKNHYKCKVMIHQSEAPYLINGENAQTRGTYFIFKLINTNIGKSIMKHLKYESCQPDYLVDSYLNLSDHGILASVIHTPGHTKGSLSVIIDHEVALVGDTLFGVFKGSVCPPFADEPALMIRSWKKLLETNCRIFLPSHGGERSREEVVNEYNKRNSIYF